MLFAQLNIFCFILQEYYDDEDPTYTCNHCGAFMWLGERINKRVVSKQTPVFTLCCKQGKVKVPKLKDPPKTLLVLLYNGDEKSKHFREFIRAYNMLFAFTSLGGHIDNSVNDGKGPYLFQLSGENYHLIGDMLPKPDEAPTFLQLYIHDTMNETSNRINAYGYHNNYSFYIKFFIHLLFLIDSFMFLFNP